MWALKNRTAYAAERTWTRDKHGAHWWLVAVKATFDLTDAGAKLADVQTPPYLAPEYTGEPGASSLLHDSDLVPPKPTTDILVLGTARTPRSAAARALAVELKLGDLSKTVIVHGNRSFIRTPEGLGLSVAEPFVEAPLIYEWAFGGTDLSDPDPARHAQDGRNPVGKGFALRWQSLVGKPAWRIEYPNRDPAHAGPAGLGPLCSHWSPRLEHAGTYDAAWVDAQKPLLPHDYDDRFLLTAPFDQRPSQHLRGGEPVALGGMTPGGLLTFSLPRIYLAFTTYIGKKQHEHRSTLGTVLIEPDLKQLQLVWHTSLRVSGADVEHLDETRIREKKYIW